MECEKYCSEERIFWLQGLFITHLAVLLGRLHFVCQQHTPRPFMEHDCSYPKDLLLLLQLIHPRVLVFSVARNCSGFFL
jgi:hypothetical protein